MVSTRSRNKKKPGVVLQQSSPVMSKLTPTRKRKPRPATVHKTPIKGRTDAKQKAPESAVKTQKSQKSKNKKNIQSKSKDMDPINPVAEDKKQKFEYAEIAGKDLEEMKREMMERIEQIGEVDYNAILRDFDIEVESRIRMMVKYQERAASSIRDILDLKLLLLPQKIREMPFSEFARNEKDTQRPKTPVSTANTRMYNLKTPKLFKRLKKRGHTQKTPEITPKIYKLSKKEKKSELVGINTKFTTKSGKTGTTGINGEELANIEAILQGGKTMPLDELAKAKDLNREIRATTLRRLRLMKKEIAAVISSLSVDMIQQQATPHMHQRTPK